MGNWFATMLGAVVGILVAIEINNGQIEVQRKDEQLKREAEKRDHQLLTLSLLQDELEFNKEIIADAVQRQGDHPNIIVMPGPRAASWNAILASGELKWLDNLSLVDLLTKTYHTIEFIIALERNYYDPGFAMEVKYTDEQNQARKGIAGERARGAVIYFRTQVLLQIEESLQEVRKRLMVLRPIPNEKA